MSKISNLIDFYNSKSLNTDTLSSDKVGGPGKISSNSSKFTGNGIMDYREARIHQLVNGPKTRKKEIFAKHGKSEKNTGSTEGQIALFTARINHLSQHLQVNKKDNSTELSLIKLVGKRRSLLNYLAKTNIHGYRALIKELEIRK